MILLFSLSLISSNFFSVDIGTQYIKIAQETIDGKPKIVPNEQNLLYRPAAVAYKYSKSIPERLCDADFKDLQIKFGKAAVSILKKNPQRGIRFVPHILGRTNDSFETSSNANSTDLLALLLINEFKQISTLNSETIVSVPSHWTHFQREMISYAFTASNMQANVIIDDVIALSVLYTHSKEGYLRARPRHSLLIDIGATSIKVYGLYAKYYSNKFIVNETSRSWSEESGTYFFAKSYSESHKIKQSKAEKLIQKLNSTEGIEEPVKKLKETIQKAIEFIRDKYELPINEIQLIGGGARIPFVVESIKTITKDIPIKYDFNSMEANVQGALLYGMMTEEESSITPTYVVRLPNSDISLVCDNDSKTTVQYCKQFDSCIHGPMIFKCDGCNKIEIKCSKNGIPLNANQVTQTINLKYMPYKGDNQSFGKVTVESPDQYVRQIQWCSKGKKCIDIPFDIDVDLYKGLKNSTKWISDYNNEKLSIEKLRHLIATVEEKITRLSVFFNDKDSVNIEPTQQFSQEMKEKFEQYQKYFNDGTIDTFDADSAKKANDELSDIMKTLGIK